MLGSGAERSKKTQGDNEQQKSSSGELERVIADIELVNIVHLCLQDPESPVINMNEKNSTYISLLEENGIHTEPPDNFKRHLKGLISENVPGADFVKSKRKNEPKRVCSTKTKEELIHIATKKGDEASDVKVLLQAASILRGEISTSEKWNFEGCFSDFEAPQRLYLFLKWLIEGPKEKCREREKNTPSTKMQATLLII